MASDIFLYLTATTAIIVTILSCVSDAQQYFQNNNNNGYPSSTIPRGYQPPPSPALLPPLDYRQNQQQQQQQQRQYQFGPFQPQFVAQRPTSHFSTVTTQNPFPPAVTYPVDFPPPSNNAVQQQPVQSQNFNNNNNQYVPSTQPVSQSSSPPMRFIPDLRPPIIINTLIQVYVDGKNKTIGNNPALEGRVVTGDYNNDRIILTKVFDIKTQKFIEENDGINKNNRKNLIAVKGLAETNSTKIARDDLQKELEKELENSIPLILDELDKIKINKAHMMAKDNMMTDNVNVNTQQQKVGSKNNEKLQQSKNNNAEGEEVSIEDLEKLIREGLNELEDGEAKKQLEKEFKEVVEATTNTTATADVITSAISSSSAETTTQTIIIEEVNTERVITSAVTHVGNMVIREMEQRPEVQTNEDSEDVFSPSTLPPGIVTFVANIEPEINDATTSTSSPTRTLTMTTPKAIVVVTPERAEMMAPVKAMVIKSQESIEKEEEAKWRSTPEPAEMMAPEKAMTMESEEDMEVDKQTPEPPEMIMPIKAMVIKSIEEEEATTHAPVTAEMVVPEMAMIIKSVEEDDEATTLPSTTLPPTTISTTTTTTTPKPTTPTSTTTTTTTTTPSTTPEPTTPIPTTTESTTELPTTTEIETTTELLTTPTTEIETTTLEITETSTFAETPTTEEITSTTSSTPTTTTTTETPSPSTTITLPFTSEQCEIPNDESDTLKGDVLFLLDSSTSIGNKTFKKMVQLVKQTVLNFSNIGPKGVQFALIQYNREPWLEFTFRKHTCLSLLLDDIEDTEFMNGPSNLGRALTKVMKYAFTPARGDRLDVENIVVLVTDGFSEDKVQLPVTLSRQNGTTPIVVATFEGKKDILMDIAEGEKNNMFNLTEAIHKPLGELLAQRIKEVLQKGGNNNEIENDITSTTTKTTSLPPPFTSPSSSLATTSRNGEIIIEETDTTTPQEKVMQQNEVKPSLVEIENSASPPVVPMLPIEDDDSVQAACGLEDIQAHFDVEERFAGIVVARDFSNTSECFVSIPLINKNSKTLRKISIKINYTQCGVSVMKSEFPKGVNFSIVLNLLHNHEIVTAQDKSFIIQCFRPTGVINSSLEAKLDVIGHLPITKTISLTVAPPKCHYSLRQDSVNGPIVLKARIGQVVYHKWECDGESVTNSVYGIYVHDCKARNNSKQDYPIINKHGCSADSTILNEIIYANDRLLAFAKSYVFTLTDITSLLFTCKVSLCVRDGDGCEGYSPPMCASSNSSNDVLLTRRVRNYDGALQTALTSELSTEMVDVSDPLTAIRIHQLRLPIVLVIIVALLSGSIVGIIWHLCQNRNSKKYFSRSGTSHSTFPDDESTTDKSETLSFRSLDFRTPEERSMDLSEVVSTPASPSEVRRP